MLAGAVGDALGWPYERPSHDLPAGHRDAAGFFGWRRTTDRFRPFTEEVAPGEYSDDTQLTIAVARARLAAGPEWAAWLERVELPFLSCYESGAGATVKRACRSWASGRPPWAAAPKDRARYFAGGANGVAMRVAPHAIAHHAEDGFAELARDVVRDGATTHGHPRALVGALVQAYALWSSLRRPAPLGYGWLVDTVLDGSSEWGAPVWQGLPEPWAEQADRELPGGYGEAWRATVAETEEFLRAARKELAEGAAGAPAPFLARSGLTARDSRGSGTLCAVAAAYLAARSASAPDRALRIPVRMRGADTDTLAAMTGTLLGAGLGQEWLGALGRTVQDSVLLARLAEELAAGPSGEPGGAVPPPEAPVSPADFAERLAGCGAGDSVRLPDGRTAEVLSTAPERGGAWQAVCTRVRTADGQSLRFRHSLRKAPAAPAGRSGGPPAAELRGAHLPVRSLGRVAAVLEELFGLYPAQRGGSWAAYGGLILTEAPPPAEEAPGRQEDRPEGSSPRAVAGDGRKDERPAEAPLRAVAGDGREPAQLRLSTADGSAALDRARASAWSEAVEETADGFIVRADPWLNVHVSCPARPRRRTSRS
ncbi:ADP-ribosylglycohydrolase family protein [Nocardiopsis composta]